MIGAGAAFGPVLAGLAMDLVGAAGFYVILGVLHALIAVAALSAFVLERHLPRQRSSVPMPVGAGLIAETERQPDSR